MPFLAIGVVAFIALSLAGAKAEDESRIEKGEDYHYDHVDDDPYL